MRALRATVAAVALGLALACGDTLVDHTGTTYLDPCPDTAGVARISCGGVCVEEGTTACGLACADCTGSAPANATGACVDHACTFTCDAGLLRCGAACCGVAAVAAGGAHTCAVTSAGTVRCWGANDAGQLGTGAAGPDSPYPVDAAGIVGATAVAAGQRHACALAAGGAVWCWGANDRGQLGSAGGPAPRAVPGVVATAVAAGGDHSCALVAGGAVRCWGANASGELGNGSTADAATPVAVSSLSGATAVTAGASHTCALVVGGAVRCWGANASGQLGDGSTAGRTTPVAAGALAGQVALAAGAAHTCAADGSVLSCWGDNAFFQLGTRTVAQSLVPLAADRVSVNPVSLGAGRAHTCALQQVAGGLQCVGDNTSNQLGAVAADDKVDVAFASAAIPGRVAAGGDHACAILADGTLWCWGRNDRGEVGDGTTQPPSVPVRVSGR